MDDDSHSGRPVHSTVTDWDYSSLAAHYDRRPDYAPTSIDLAIAAMGLEATDAIADVGAGTGKLARPLAERGLIVHAVEPNAEMRRYGVRNTEGLSVHWREGTAERTGIVDHSVRAAWFGSSFNVVDRPAALNECRRIVAPRGWFCCMWNHRDLADPVQARIEDIIRRAIPGYHYGARREDPTQLLAATGFFVEIHPFSVSFMTRMTRQAVIDAWQSHATLARQAGAALPGILDAIGAELTDDPVDVPYTTRGWYAQFA